MKIITRSRSRSLKVSKGQIFLNIFQRTVWKLLPGVEAEDYVWKKDEFFHTCLKNSLKMITTDSNGRVHVSKVQISSQILKE